MNIAERFLLSEANCEICTPVCQVVVVTGRSIEIVLLPEAVCVLDLYTYTTLKALEKVGSANQCMLFDGI